MVVFGEAVVPAGGDATPLPFLGIYDTFQRKSGPSGPPSRHFRIRSYLFAMQIEHDPHEHDKFPDYGKRKWAKENFGPNPKPSDLVGYLLPFAAVAVVLFLWRNGWPF